MKRLNGLWNDTLVRTLKYQGNGIRNDEQQDMEGLGVRTTPKGRKSFYYKYEKDGVKRHLGLNKYIEKSDSLSKAKEKMRQAIKDIDDGRDPVSDKKMKKVERKTAYTVAELADYFIDNHCKKIVANGTVKNKGLKDQGHKYRQQLDRLIIPVWGNRKADDITDKHVFDLVHHIAEQTPAQGNNTLRLISSMFNYGIYKARILKHRVSPAFKMAEPAERNSCDRELDTDEIKVLLNKLLDPDSGLMGDQVTKEAILVMLFTGLRDNEVVNMHSREFCDHGWLEIPKERMKNSKTHRVYLTEFVREIIGDRQGYIFKTPKGDKPITVGSLGGFCRNNTVGTWDEREREKKGGRAAPHRLGMVKWTPRDLRTTVYTQMGALGIPPHVKTRVFSHTEATKGETQVGMKHYDKYEYAPEKRDAWERWEDTLLGLIGKAPTAKPTTPANVIPINRKAA
jgi:integrase